MEDEDEDEDDQSSSLSTREQSQSSNSNAPVNMLSSTSDRSWVIEHSQTLQQRMRPESDKHQSKVPRRYE